MSDSGARRSGGSQERARPGRAWRLAKALIGILALAAVAWTGVAWATWPDVERLARERPDTTAFMRRYLERRVEQPDLPALRWAWAPLAETSVHAQRAVVSAEDMEFFHHRGFSSSEIRAAIQDALRGDDLRGASTITQQLAKNLWLTPSRNPLRKVREALLTRQLERRLSKSRILEIYLNVVELGPGIYGVETAARHYFGGSAAALTARQAAMLAASLPRPSSWHPGVESRAYASYVDDVLGRMGRAEFLWSYVRGSVPIDLEPSPVDSGLLAIPTPPGVGVLVPSPVPDSGVVVPPPPPDTGLVVPT
jgi:monofunctional biosynthetic peptidoglycan transglycosylase